MYDESNIWFIARWRDEELNGTKKSRLVAFKMRFYLIYYAICRPFAVVRHFSNKKQSYSLTMFLIFDLWTAYRIGRIQYHSPLYLLMKSHSYCIHWTLQRNKRKKNKCAHFVWLFVCLLNVLKLLSVDFVKMFVEKFSAHWMFNARAWPAI